MHNTSDTSKSRGQLSSTKRALIEERLRGRLTHAAEAPIPRRPEREPAVLSFAQQRLWFISQLEPDAALYNMPTALRLTGTLDLDALQRAFGEIVRRHEVLRTVFLDAGGQPVQVVKEASPVTLPVTDLSELPPAERDAELTRLRMEEARRPFDLSTGPLLRAALLRLREDEHVLLLTMHHIASDAWSLSVLVREAGALYDAFASGRPSPLPELPVQYADYAVWQRRHLAGERLEAQLGYWRRQLAGLGPTLELPGAKPRPAAQTFRGGHITFQVGREVTEGLRAAGRGQGATLFMVLLAGFTALLGRYTGEREVAVGTDVANRTRGETEGLIGFFVNQLVLRVDISGDPTFGELVARAREVCLGAYARQEAPFERVVEELAPERTLSHTPLFQVKLLLQNTPAEAVEVPGLRMEALRSDSGAARFDLTASATEVNGAMAVSLQYNADLFERSTIERMAGHYRTLLEAAAADPSQRLSRLPLLGEAERRRLLVEFNDTEDEYPRSLRVHQLFTRQAQRTPEATALVCGGDSLTYQELDERSNRLARYLRGLGVGPEVLVGICLNRSAAMVEAVLGVLKAGAAYLPLDPEYPAQRLGWMLADSNAALVLTESEAAGHLPAHWGHVVSLDEVDEEVRAQSAAPPEDVATAESLAYVIYTSGSTGRPKGVMVAHGGLTNLACAQRHFLGLGPGARMLQFASLSFDAAACELFFALCSGAASCVAGSGERAGAALAEFLRRAGVTHATLPPAVLAQLDPEEAPELTAVISVGEALPGWVAGRWVGAGRRLLNGYGPTEATVGAAVGECGPGGRVGIGRPLPNVRAYVLDEHFNPTPAGVAGELHVGGEGLARGYLNRPALTAERFIPDPFGPAGSRLYRTGDVCRWNEEGTLEYVGRADEQVKVRGFRVEPGEIEAALCLHPSLQAAMVLPRQDGEEQTSLVAYCVVRQGQPGEGAAGGALVKELRSHLAERLPPYMVPSAFVMLERLPLTPNGKVDRAALPEPERVAEAAELVPPRTPVEEILTGVWTDVLRVEPISIYDNFFELGGHSLLATQLASRVREVFRVEVPLRLLFEQPTVAGLAEKVEALLRAADADAPLPPIEPVGRAGRLPLSFAQQRLWFIDQLEGGSTFYNIPAALRLKGDLDVNALGQALSEIMRRHEVLRTYFEVTESQAAQVIAESADVRLPVVDLGGLDEEAREAEAARLMKTEAERPFDLTTGPLLRAGLLRLGADEHVLLLTLHHIASDAWSLGVLVREAAALYEAFAAGRPSPLPELPVQYADYAAWQRRYLAGERLEAQLAYWRRQLTGAPPALELPGARTRPTAQGYRGQRVALRVGAEVTQGLRGVGRAEGATLFMTLTAGFAALLSRYTGERDVVVGTDVANRTRGETEGLIGFFVNQLVLRTDLGGDPTFTELVGRVREVCLGAYAHQDVPFERVVEELAPERTLSHTPLFQVKLLLQNAPAEALKVTGLSIEGLKVERETAEFDLTVSIAEAPDGLYTTFEYNADLFEAETVERLGGHYRELLAGAAADPSLPLSRLPLLGEPERRRLLVEFNETARPYRKENVHELFGGHARRTPEADAVVSGEERLSYRELDERSNRLARYLRGLGVGPETLVGICLGRSAEMVTAVLGVLKAGGAYLPLDPEYPAQRLGWMLGDSGAGLVLTRGEAGAHLPAHWGLVVDLEEAGEQIRAQDAGPLEDVATAESLAYVIYTSGSTGRPKGVMVAHGGLTNLATAQRHFLGLGPGARMLQFASLSFDAAAFELFTALCSGAASCVAGSGERAGAALSEFLRRAGVTHATLPPAVLAQLDPAEAPELATVISVGEALPGWVAARWAGAGRRLLNGYGPTEATVAAAAGECAPGGRVGIGRPLPNVRAYVLDEGMQPTPTGVGGELYIGGEGLARGYLNRPGLTAERFIPNPFGPAGSRLYRTGDVCRWNEEGTLEYVGRADEQVKVRGFRVEPGEIEAALCRHPGVREALVLAREEVTGDKRLIAYVVSDDGQGAGAGELRNHLRQSLPEYMVPSAFVALEQLPLTPNGKVDRAALPEPEANAPEASKSFVAPRNELEQTIAGVWAEVLGVEKVGVHDNFFDLGGHSLLVAKTYARLREELAGEFTMMHLFEYPTVSTLAEFISDGAGEPAAAAAGDARGEARKDLLKRRRELRQHRRAKATAGGQADE